MHDLTRQQRQLLVQKFKHARVFQVIANPLEQSRTLGHDFAILEDSLAIARMYLAQRPIEKTPSLFRRPIYQVQIHLGEEHYLHLPDHIDGAPWNAIELESFALHARRQLY